MKSEDIIFLEGDSYKNRNLMVGIPTRGMIHYKVVSSWKTLLFPINSKSVQVWAHNFEVGEARNGIVESFLGQKDLKYLLFIDDDLVIPDDALLRHIRLMDAHGADIIGGVYRLKDGSGNIVAYKYKNDMINSITDEECLSNEYLDVDVVGMGFTLIKREVFEKIRGSWFKTIQETCSKGTRCFTEDVYFCKRAKDLGFKIGLNSHITMGHIDTNTNIIF